MVFCRACFFLSGYKQEMKKIIHIITTINRGGAENHLLGLVKEQVNKNWQIKVAFLKGAGYWQSAFEGLGVEVIPLKLNRYGDIKPIYKLRHLIQSYNPDIVHAHMPPAELYTRIALIGISHKELPMVCSKHNDEPFFKGMGHKVLGKWVAKRANKIIAISDAVNRYICGNGLGCDSKKVITIHYGIDSTQYENVDIDCIRAARKSWGVGDDAYVIGTVARLAPQKAIHVLLEGYAIYLKNAAHPSKLVIVGEGPLASELKSISTRLGIEDHVIWAGLREDIPVVMNAYDLFALTSVYEGFGLVLLEAMASAKPVVASCVSAIPEIVEDNISGILVPSNRPELFADAFKFFENEPNRRKYGIAGLGRARKEFAIEKMVDSIDEVYFNLLNTHS